MQIKYFTALFGAGVALAGAAGFEANEIQIDPASVVPGELLRGQHHRIVSPATVNGLSNIYTIESSFGTFTATGDLKLRVRLHEIEAIAGLRAIDKAELAAQSAGKVLTRPVETVAQVVDEPVETLKGVPKGVSKWFKRTSRRVKDGYESAKEAAEQANESSSSDSSGQGGSDAGGKIVDASKNFAKRFFGLDSAYRSLARQFKVDPYTDNEVLREDLKEISRYSAAGSFGAGQFMIPLPDSIGLLNDVSALVWDSDPLDLLIRNEEALRKMGADESLIKSFFENPYFTPTGQTLIVTALESMNDVDHRLVLIEYASESQSSDDSGFIVRVAEFFQIYHSKNQRLTRLVATDYLPFAVNQEGHAVLFAPVDQLRWLETIAEAAHELTAIAQKVAPGKAGEMWVQGRASKAAETNLPGWRIIPDAFNRFTEQG